MIRKIIHPSSSESANHPASNTNSNTNSDPSSGPNQLVLFESACDSKMASLISFAMTLAIIHPEILEAIKNDLDVHALNKKRERVEHQRAIDSKTETLIDVDPVDSPSDEKPKLEIGRPRMAPEIVLVFLLLRGWLDGSCKNSRSEDAIKESMSLRVCLEDRGFSLPGISTIEENLNALSLETMDKIHQAQVAIAHTEGLDDFEILLGDSTATASASARPVDSDTIAKLIDRISTNFNKLEKMGISGCSMEEFSDTLKEINQLRHRIAMLETSSAKQAEKAEQEEKENNTVEPGKQVESGKKESSKVRYRREFYEKLYALGDEILPRFEEMLEQAKRELEKLECLPKERKTFEDLVLHMNEDLDAARRGIMYSRKRVVDGGKPSSKRGEMPWGVSDKDASFIEKGGHEKTFGFRPQVAVSGKGLVTALIVPVGNAADQSQCVPLIDESIRVTNVVPKIASFDDGYSSAANLKGCKDRGIDVVSFSGSRGKALQGEETWDSESNKEARLKRNGVESAISVLKGIEGFGKLTRVGIKAVRAELLEKVLAYNALKIVSLRQKKKRKEAKIAADARQVA